MHCLCVIQEGQAADRKRLELERSLDGYAREQLHDSMTVTWLPVAEGSGFTAGAPSTSSIVSLAANERLDQPHRESVLRGIVSLWTDATGCSIDEVVAVVADPA